MNRPEMLSIAKKINPLYLLILSLLLIGSASARADSVLDWNKIAVDTAVANKANPFAQGRYAAIVQLAVFEAVNSITQEYQPYLGITAASPDASPETAAIEAAFKVLSFYFGATSQAALDAARQSSLAAIPDGQAKIDGIATGDSAAQAMINLRMNDGSSTPPLTKAPGAAVPGEWQLTKGCTAGIAYNWQFITPFGISSAGNYLLSPPPSLTSEAYAKTYNEVMTVGEMQSAERPQDRADVALFFCGHVANAGNEPGCPRGCRGRAPFALGKCSRTGSGQYGDQ